jgi:hypothetical protein
MITEPSLPEETEVLLFFCGQYWEEIRHTEKQRAMLANLIILIASGVLGLSLQQGLSRAVIPLAALMIVLGFYGAITTLKLHERYRFLQARLDHFYGHINQLHPKALFLELRAQADKEHKEEFPFLEWVHVYWLWLLIHILISLGGIILLAISISRKG